MNFAGVVFDETLGEDPFLVGHLGAAMVRGLQGSDDGTIKPDHVAATLKHFAGYAGTAGRPKQVPLPKRDEASSGY